MLESKAMASEASFNCLHLLTYSPNHLQPAYLLCNKVVQRLQVLHIRDLHVIRIVPLGHATEVDIAAGLVGLGLLVAAVGWPPLFLLFPLGSRHIHHPLVPLLQTHDSGPRLVLLLRHARHRQGNGGGVG